MNPICCRIYKKGGNIGDLYFFSKMRNMNQVIMGAAEDRALELR